MKRATGDWEQVECLYIEENQDIQGTQENQDIQCEQWNQDIQSTQEKQGTQEEQDYLETGYPALYRQLFTDLIQKQLKNKTILRQETRLFTDSFSQICYRRI